MIELKKLINNYAGFVSRHPYLIILLVIFLSIIAVFGAKMVQMESLDYQDILPANIDVIVTMDKIKDNFGGIDSAIIVVEIDPNYKDSNEPRDVREPEVIRYLHLLTESVKHVDDVTNAVSAATLLKQDNDGYLPKSKNEVIELNSPSLNSYISDDYKLALIRISLSEDYSEAEILKDLTKIIEEVPRVPGINVNIAGQELAMTIVTQSLQSDMTRTSRLSLLGILIVLFLLFRSVRFGLTPLVTIGIGVLWAFGFIGLIGMGMNSATSGVISMIMGIGIDFGIQIVTRYRQELLIKKPKQAIADTMNVVFMPMATTTLAAMIGFKAMGLGELTMMADMGRMMSYGIVACFLAAITVVPAVLIISERLINKEMREEDEKELLQNEKKLIQKIFSNKKQKRGRRK